MVYFRLSIRVTVAASMLTIADENVAVVMPVNILGFSLALTTAEVRPSVRRSAV